LQSRNSKRNARAGACRARFRRFFGNLKSQTLGAGVLSRGLRRALKSASASIADCGCFASSRLLARVASAGLMRREMSPVVSGDFIALVARNAVSALKHEEPHRARRVSKRERERERERQTGIRTAARAQSILRDAVKFITRASLMSIIVFFSEIARRSL